MNVQLTQLRPWQVIYKRILVNIEYVRDALIKHVDSIYEKPERMPVQYCMSPTVTGKHKASQLVLERQSVS